MASAFESASKRGKLGWDAFPTPRAQRGPDLGAAAVWPAETGILNGMTLDEYQAKARSTAIYPEGARVLYPTLKLAGEAGEVAEKLGKLMRDEGFEVGRPLAGEARDALVKELGDVLWYVANLAADLDVGLDEVASVNLEKLASRKERGVIHGSGDDR